MSNIHSSSLRKDQIIIVRGKTTFSRLVRPIEGKELADRIANSRSKFPVTEPHTTVSLVDAAVQFADAANPTIEEQFVQEKLYSIKSGDNAGRTGYSIDNKSTYLPLVFQPDPENPNQHVQVILDNDLDKDLDVSLVLNTFQAGSYANKGIGLQQVILHEPVRYYSQGINTNELAARGITIAGPVQRVQASDAPAVTGPRQTEGASQQNLPANTAIDPETGYALPAPGPAQAPAAQAPAPAPQAQAQPADAQPAPQPAQPAQAAQPAQETPEQRIARLEAELAATQNSGGNSAFDAPQAQPAAQGSDTPAPWDVGQSDGAYRG